MQMYFHIGLHKTGTTFLQKEVFPRVATTGFRFVGKMPELMKYIVYQDPAYFDAATVREQILRHTEGQTTVLVSNEDLSGDPLNGGLHRTSILANLHSCFPSARIVLFLRRQDDWALSNYLGSIRRGSNLPLWRVFEPALSYEKAWQRRYPNPTLELFLYYPYVRQLKALFGDASALVLPYERLRTHCDEVIRSLCEFMGVSRPDYRNVKRNYTWGRRRVAFHRLLNLFVNSPQNPYGFIRGIPAYSRRAGELRFVTLRRLLVRSGLIESYDRLLDRLDSRFVDTAGVCRQILLKCADDNERIQKEFGIDLEPYGYLVRRGDS